MIIIFNLSCGSHKYVKYTRSAKKITTDHITPISPQKERMDGQQDANIIFTDPLFLPWHMPIQSRKNTKFGIYTVKVSEINQNYVLRTLLLS